MGLEPFSAALRCAVIPVRGERCEIWSCIDRGLHHHHLRCERCEIFPGDRDLSSGYLDTYLDRIGLKIWMNRVTAVGLVGRYAISGYEVKKCLTVTEQ